MADSLLRDPVPPGIGVTSNGVPLFPLYNGEVTEDDIPAGYFAAYFETVDNLKLVGKTADGTPFSSDILITSS